jgi:antitoxin PrlF
MVLPKDVREKAGIAPGDKLAVVSWVQKGEICCLSLIKANDMVDYVKDLLGPMMEELIKK